MTHVIKTVITDLCTCLFFLVCLYKDVPFFQPYKQKNFCDIKLVQKTRRICFNKTLVLCCITFLDDALLIIRMLQLPDYSTCFLKWTSRMLKCMCVALNVMFYDMMCYRLSPGANLEQKGRREQSDIQMWLQGQHETQARSSFKLQSCAFFFLLTPRVLTCNRFYHRRWRRQDRVP